MVVLLYFFIIFFCQPVVAPLDPTILQSKHNYKTKPIQIKDTFVYYNSLKYLVGMSGNSYKITTALN